MDLGLDIYDYKDGVYSKVVNFNRNLSNAFIVGYFISDSKHSNTLSKADVLFKDKINDLDSKLVPYGEMFNNVKSINKEKAENIRKLINAQDMSIGTMVYLNKFKLDINKEKYKFKIKVDDNFLKDIYKNLYYINEIYEGDRSNLRYKEVLRDIIKVISKKDIGHLNAVNILGLNLLDIAYSYKCNDINLEELFNWISSGGIKVKIGDKNKIKNIIEIIIEKEKNSNLSDIYISTLKNIFDVVIRNESKNTCIGIVNSMDMRNFNIKQKYIYLLFVAMCINTEKFSLTDINIKKRGEINKTVYNVIKETIFNPKIFRCYGCSLICMLSSIVYKDTIYDISIDISKMDLEYENIMAYFALCGTIDYNDESDEIILYEIRRCLLYLKNYDIRFNQTVYKVVLYYLNFMSVKSDKAIQDFFRKLVHDCNEKDCANRKGKRVKGGYLYRELIDNFLCLLDKLDAYKFMIDNNFFTENKELLKEVVNPYKYFKQCIRYYNKQNKLGNLDILRNLKNMIQIFKIEGETIVKIGNEFNINANIIAKICDISNVIFVDGSKACSIYPVI